jgi:hypothetical protein
MFQDLPQLIKQWIIQNSVYNVIFM